MEGSDFQAFAGKYGVLAGAQALAVTALAPLERCKLILQTQAQVKVPLVERYPNFSAYLRTVPRVEGFRRFWRGNSASIGHIAVSTLLRYPLLCVVLTDNSLAAQSALGLGLLTLSYPLDLVRTRLACDLIRKTERPIYEGLVDTLVKTISDEGVRGLYKGLSVTLGTFLPLLLLEQAFTYPVAIYLKQHSDSMLEDQIKKHSVSLAMAQLVLYPADTIRRKLQVAGDRNHEGMQSARQCCARLYRIEGIKGFYSGVLLNSLRLPPTLAIFYYLSDFARISSY